MIACILVIAALILVHSGGSSATTVLPAAGNNILVYSPTCPHCHALIQYLQKKGLMQRWHIKETTDPEAISKILQRYGLSFEGYPTLVIYAPDANLPSFIKTAPYIILVGFPAGPNDVNGYYMGEKMDLSLCRGMHGTPVYEKGTYLFCVRKDGVILGNEHAIDWIAQKLQ